MSRCTGTDCPGWYYIERGSNEIAFCDCKAGQNPVEIMRKAQAEIQRLRGRLLKIKTLVKDW